MASDGADQSSGSSSISRRVSAIQRQMQTTVMILSLIHIFNLVNSCGALAWQTVFHFHMHVIPRYTGDPLKLPWVPAPGDPAEIAAAAQELTQR